MCKIKRNTRKYEENITKHRHKKRNNAKINDYDINEKRLCVIQLIFTSCQLKKLPERVDEYQSIFRTPSM